MHETEEHVLQMKNGGAWATEAEIMASATYFQTDIFVYTEYGWAVYGVNHLGERKHDCCIYICHLNNHFSFVKNIMTLFSVQLVAVVQLSDKIDKEILP